SRASHDAQSPSLRCVEDGASQAQAHRKLSAHLPGWIRLLTTRRALVLGAAVCYLLIIFNLIYGVASLARLKPWRPLHDVTATELQRAMPVAGEIERASGTPAVRTGLLPTPLGVAGDHVVRQ